MFVPKSDSDAVRKVREHLGVEKLAFCRQEHTKCQKAMHELDRSTYRQQYWASQGFKK
jgi:hypothetical protein